MDVTIGNSDVKYDFQQWMMSEVSPERQMIFDSDSKTMQYNSQIIASTITSGLNVKRISYEISESEEFKKLMQISKAKTSKSRLKENKDKSKNTRNLMNVVRHTVTNTENKKSKTKKYVVKRKSKRLRSDLNQEWTFKPKLDKKSMSMMKRHHEFSSISRIDRLTSRKRSSNKTPISHKIQNEIMEMQECTFTPDLTSTKWK